MILCMMQGHAQNRLRGSSNEAFNERGKNAITKFEDHRKKRKEEFDKYVKKVKKEYLEAVASAWKQFEGAEPIPKPKDEHVTPAVAPKRGKNTPKQSKRIIVDEVVKPVNVTLNKAEYEMEADTTITSIVIEPTVGKSIVGANTSLTNPVTMEVKEVYPSMVQSVFISPVEPMHIDVSMPIEIGPDLHLANPDIVEVAFFGTTLKIHFDKNNLIKLKDVNESQVLKALTYMTKSRKYDDLLLDCLAVKEGLNLNDWAYIQFLKAISYNIGGERTNESTLLMAYLYMLSGYRMRLAMDDDSVLYMLYGTRHQIYDNVLYKFKGDPNYYYGVEKLPSTLMMVDKIFEEQYPLSLLIDQVPLLKENRTDVREIVSKKFPWVRVPVSVNKNILDFFDSYPSSMYGKNMMTRWAIYANTQMEKSVKDELYPKLRTFIEGKSQEEALSILLDWVQQGLEYGYDSEIWGGDRPFFAEESLYYPYCDCEDRSILLTRLVRDLLGLKCLLVYYPGHLASAVCLDDEIDGDYIVIGKDKYIIADATFLGADLGQTMDGLDNGTAEVIVLE